jgi:HYR domain/PKD domain
MISWERIKVRYAIVGSCLLMLLAGQLLGRVSSIAGASSSAMLPSAASSTAVDPYAPPSSLCISDSLANTDFVYNRAGTTPPCSVFTTGNFFDAYTFTVSGCAPATVTVSTCTGPCGTQTALDTVVFVYQKTGGAAATPADPIFKPANPCTNLIGSSNNFCGLSSQVTTTLQTTAGSGDFVVIVTSNLTGQTGPYNLSVSSATCTIVQQPQTCVYVLSPTEQTFQLGGGTGSVTVTAQAICGWTAASNDSFIHVTSGALGTGNGAVGYSVDANSGGPRIGSMTIAGQTFTVTQEAGAVSLPCIRDALVAGNSFVRPSAGATISCPGPPPNPTVFYKAYELTLSGCASGIVTASTCGTSPCSGPAGTLADTILFIYRKSDGSPSTPGSPIFNPSSPCTNAIVGNNNFAACGTLSQTSTALNAGSFVVVVTSNGAGQTGTFNLAVTAPGCTLGQTLPCSIVCPANITTPNDANQCGKVVTYAPTTTGACGTVTCTPASGSFFPVGTTTVTCTSQAGPSCSFTVSVQDTQPPTVTCPSNITAPAASGQCSAPVSYTTPSASDNCPGATVACVPASGSTFPKGTTTVTCTATDASSNSATCSFAVTVTDAQPPTVTCPSNITTQTAANQCSAVVSYTTPTANDNCPGATVACVPPSGSTFPKGTTTVTCTATDASSNTATCTFTVTVNDNQPPTVTCPSNITTPAPSGQCSAAVSYTTPTASDNCPGATVACVPLSGSTFPKGTTTVTCTATDSSSNTSSCNFTVTVVDTQPPIISCPANITVAGNILGSCSANVSPGTANATDNCPGVVVVGVRSDSQALNAPYPQGMTTITWTATDTSNNTASCQQTVTVTNPSPVVTITGPPSGSLYVVNSAVNFTGSYTDNAGGTHTAQWSFVSNNQNITQAGTVNESTGAVTATYTFTSAGVYLVTLTVNDGCGGSGTANTVDGLTAMVVVYDTDGGFVTGGGWINSPAGAYTPDPTLTGRASFGFVSKYQHGAGVPTGNTEFQFHAGNFNFSSTVYEWLVIAGARAQYKGSGTVNGAGDYRFILTAIDGQVNGGGGVDKFRIRIWNNNGGGIVYDNQMNDPDSADPTTVLGGGSIVIHN